MDKKELLFELLKRTVLEQSGDGVAVVVSNQYLELAEDFWNLEINSPNAYFTDKGTSENYSEVCFSPHDEPNSQESIIFTCDVGIKSLDMYDLIIFAENFK